MASEGPPRAEAILCVRVPCREGRERVWQAIELLRQEQRQPQQPTVSGPVPQPKTRPRRHLGSP
jgi:hypothetical protein